MTDVKDRTNLDWMDAPLKADRWRNLWFLPSGESDWGDTIYPTEELAIKQGEKCLNDFDPNLPTDWHGQSRMLVLSHFIPIPIED